MATIFEDNFNSYNDGDLNGQGNWSGSTAFDIQGTTVKEGAKAVQCITHASNTYEITKAGTARNDGKITFYWQRDGGAGAVYLRLYEGATLCVQVGWGGSGDNRIFYGNWNTILSGPSMDTWYCVEVEWRSSDGFVRFRVNGGSWVGWVDATGNWSTGLDTVMLRAASDGGANIYWDYIAEEPIPPTITITDIVTLVDSISRKLSVKQVLSDIVALADSVIKASMLKRIFSDTLTLVGSITYKLFPWRIIVSDIVTLVDSITKKGIFKRVLSDVVSLVDGITRKVSLRIVLSDIISIVDVFGLKKRIWTFLSKSTSPTWTHKSKSTTPTWSWRIKRQ